MLYKLKQINVFNFNITILRKFLKPAELTYFKRKYSESYCVFVGTYLQFITFLFSKTISINRRKEAIRNYLTLSVWFTVIFKLILIRVMRYSVKKLSKMIACFTMCDQITIFLK